MFGKNKRRIPIYVKADCLGEECPEFQGTECESRMELLDAKGASGGIDKAPLKRQCDYALYGQVCMAGDEQVVVNAVAESPNGQGSVMELVGR
ncbi:MAG: hypothetical protein LC687_02710, partial [Actinobacteria bacterium]|nr:hypothetical protein [Actinomycetota bacterium]